MAKVHQQNYFDLPDWQVNECLREHADPKLRVNLEQTIVALLEHQGVKQQPVVDQVSTKDHSSLPDAGAKQQSVSDHLSTNDDLSLSGTGRLRSNSSEEESVTNQKSSKGTSSESEAVHELADGDCNKGHQATNPISSEMEIARKVAESGGGLSGCTTVMIKHIPLKYTQRQLMQEINKNGFAERYDFLYMPADARNHGNRGFAFVNFLDADIALDFYYKHHGGRLQKYNMEKNMVILPADLQGCERNVEQYLASRKNGKQVPHAEPAFFHQKPGFQNIETRPTKNSNTQQHNPGAHKGASRGRYNGSKSSGSANAQQQHANNTPWPNAHSMQFPVPKVPPITRFCAFCGSPRTIGGHAFCPYCGGRYHNS